MSKKYDDLLETLDNQIMGIGYNNILLDDELIAEIIDKKFISDYKDKLSEKDFEPTEEDKTSSNIPINKHANMLKVMSTIEEMLVQLLLFKKESTTWKKLKIK